MDALKRVTLILACACMLLVIYRLLKPAQPKQAGANPVTAAVATPVPTPIATPAPTPEPIAEWDWTIAKSDTFAFQAGEGRISGEIPANGATTRERVTIEAKAPVLAAFVDSGYRELLASNLNQAFRMPIFHCLQRNTLSTTVTCTLDTSTGGYVFLLKDERTGGQAFGAGVMAALGNKKPMEDATARNDVTLQYWEWKCVRNCD